MLFQTFLTMVVLTADPGVAIPREVSPTSLEKLLRSVRPIDVQSITSIKTVPDAPSPLVEDGPSFAIITLNFTGNSVYSRTTLTKIAALPTNTHITLADVSAAADRITDHYRDHGYILARAIVPPQDITDGHLVIRVVEGFIDAVDQRGDTAGLQGILAPVSDRLSAEKPLRLTTLENELILLNRLAGVEARAVLEAAPNVAGAARLTLVVKRDRAGVTYLADSLGSKESGAARQFVIVEAYGLAGAGGRTALTLGSSLPNPRLLQSIGLAHEQPLTLGALLRMSISQTLSRPGGRLAELEIAARGRAIEVGVERSFARGRGALLTIGGSLSHLTSDIRLLGEPISRDHVTVAEITASGERNTRTGSVDRLAVSGQQELGGRQAADISRFGASVSGLSVSARYDGLRRLADGTSLMLALDLRWTGQPQVAMREHDFGAAAFGRAFPAGAITGERGGAAMLELRRPMAVAFAPKAIAFEYFGFGEVAALDDLDPLDPRRRGIGSMGGGLRARASHIDAEVGGAAAIWQQNSFPSSFRVYFRFLSPF